MPCLKNITLAFNRFASTFKLEHSSIFSGVPNTLTPSIIGASIFACVMAIAGIQLLRSRAWFLWALTSASLLQCAGFIASAVHSQDGTNHLAFLASFATITFAPLFLSVAVFSTFARLSQLVMPAHLHNTKAAWTYFTRHLTTFTLVPCLVPLALFGVGIVHICKFLSPAPIEGRNGAFERLLNYELGIRQLEKAHGTQAFVCLIFAFFAGIFTIKSKSWEVNSLSVKNKNWRELMCTINIVNGAILLRSSYKMLESQAIAQSKASLGDNGPLFWLFDVMPMVAALVLFCGVKPTSYLPDQNASIALDLEAPCVDEKRGYTILDSTS